eukprot:274669-Chlamydomonas_euryale.AAC.1
MPRCGPPPRPPPPPPLPPPPPPPTPPTPKRPGRDIPMRRVLSETWPSPAARRRCGDFCGGAAMSSWRVGQFLVEAAAEAASGGGGAGGAAAAAAALRQGSFAAPSGRMYTCDEGGEHCARRGGECCGLLGCRWVHDEEGRQKVRCPAFSQTTFTPQRLLKTNGKC